MMHCEKLALTLNIDDINSLVTACISTLCQYIWDIEIAVDQSFVEFSQTKERSGEINR